MTLPSVFAALPGTACAAGPALGPSAAADANDPKAPINQPSATNGMNTRGGMDASALKNERGKSGDANTQRPASDNASK